MMTVKLFKYTLILSLSVIIFLNWVGAVYAQAATLALSPTSGTFNKGCSFTVDINLNTGGAATDGTDAILIFDTSRFTADSITPGTIYADYPGSSTDNQAGKVLVSGLSSVTSAFSGQGVFATVGFTVKDNASTGASLIKIDFDPNDKTKTTDSNVVQRSTVVDILNSVTNGTYTVGSGTCASTPQPTPGSPTGTINPPTGFINPPIGSTGSATITPPKVFPTPPKFIDDVVGGKTGTIELTATIAIVGSILTILGILGLVVL